MFELILGIIFLIVCPIVFVKNYLNWRKHNAGFRESKKASPDSDHIELEFLRGFIFGGFGFFIGLYFVLNYFALI